MATTEAGGKILDLVEAALVDCAPEPEPQALSVDVSAVAPAAPVAQAMAATIEHTGADPPPAGGR